MVATMKYQSVDRSLPPSVYFTIETCLHNKPPGYPRSPNVLACIQGSGVAESRVFHRILERGEFGVGNGRRKRPRETLMSRVAGK